MELYDVDGYRLACPTCGRLNGWRWVRLGDAYYQCTCGRLADRAAVEASEAIRLGRRRPVVDSSGSEAPT